MPRKHFSSELALFIESLALADLYSHIPDLKCASHSDAIRLRFLIYSYLKNLREEGTEKQKEQAQYVSNNWTFGLFNPFTFKSVSLAKQEDNPPISIRVQAKIHTDQFSSLLAKETQEIIALGTEQPEPSDHSDHSVKEDELIIPAQFFSMLSADHGLRMYQEALLSGTYPSRTDAERAFVEKSTIDGK